MERDRVLASHEVSSTLVPGATISYCFIDMQSISKERCLEITTHKKFNAKCQRHSKDCTSKFRACPLCLTQAEHVKMAGYIELVSCEKGKTLCKFHSINGDFRRTDPDRAAEIKKFEEEKAQRLKMIGSDPAREVPPKPAPTTSFAWPEKSGKTSPPGPTRREFFTAKAQERAKGFKEATTIAESATAAERATPEKLIVSPKQSVEIQKVVTDATSISANDPVQEKVIKELEAKVEIENVSAPKNTAPGKTISVELTETTNPISTAVNLEVEVKAEVKEKVVAEVVIAEAKAETSLPTFPVPLKKAEAGDLEIGKLINFHEVDESGVAKEVVAEIVSTEFEANWDEIRPYKDQPRKKFNKLRLQQLAGSIEEEGQLMPVLLKLTKHEKYKWELVDGERRYRAMEIVGKKTLKAILIEVKDDFDHFKKSVIANLCREGHTPLEEANAIRILLNGGYTQAKAAKLFGKSVSWVSKRLLLLELHVEVQEMMDEDLPKGSFLKTTIAEYVAEIKDKEEQLKVAKNILAKRMTTTQVYNYVYKKKFELGQTSEKKRRPSDDFRNLTALVQRTQRSVAPFTSMESEKMWELFRNRPDRDRDSVYEQVKVVLEEFRKLQQILLWM